MAVTTKRGTPASEPAQVEMVLAQIEALPTLPTVATRLLELTADETSSARQLVEIIESDQSLSGRILSASRRAHLGTSPASVRQAVVLLGFESIRSMVLSIQIFETFAHRVERAEGHFDRTGFWKHSLAVACAAGALAEAIPGSPKGPRGSKAPVKPEEAFTCGLLHDIGKVVFDACFPKSYDRVVSAAEASRGSITDIERNIFGLDHTIAGQRLAVHWKLPEMIRECAWLHHHTSASTPTRITHADAVAVVQVADRLVREMRIGYSGNHQYDEPASQAAASLGVSAEALRGIMAALPAMIEERAAFIGMERLTSGEVYQEALVQANSELARISGALSDANRRLQQRSRCLDALCSLNGALADDPSHEDVVRGALDAATLLVPGTAVAVVAFSRGRSIGVTAWARPGADASLEIVQESLVSEPGSLSDGVVGWQPGATLSAQLSDYLLSRLGHAAAWCWPIRHQHRFHGLLVLAGDARIEPGESFGLLSEACGAWLSAAESRAESRQLNEELAEMNRRLVASQAQLARMRSLAMVGEMAGGAAHELNNPLAVISGRAQLLAREDMSDEARRSASLIAEHAHRASAIVSELMDFAKPAAPQPVVWAPAMLLNQIRGQWLERGVLSRDQFELALSDDVPEIRSDVAQTRMLFDAVIANAVEAMREVSAPRLLVNCLPDLADDRVVIRIQDNGCGMAPEVMERAMDPFYSYRSAGRGRGLGLSRAARYAEVNGGRIRLSSVPGEGTCVFVELPSAS